MDRLLQDLRFAARTLRKNPGFSLLAALTLALGIGATAAIFTVLHSVVLNPLPYPGSDRLVRIQNAVPGVSPDARWNFSPAAYFHVRENSRTLQELGVYLTEEVTLTEGGEAERITSAMVSDGVMSALGARPALGRVITRADDRPASEDPEIGWPNPAEPVAVLGHDFWKRRFGGDPDVVGRTMEIGGSSVPVVGVMAAGVDLPDPGVSADVWLPLGLNPAGIPRNWHSFVAVGRLRDGATVAAVQEEMQRFTDRFEELFPSAYTAGFMEESGFRPVVTTLHAFVVGDLGRTLWILFGAVGLVLLIACANVANLFLVRAEGRRREVAIRSALGATRGRVAGHFLVEGVLLAMMGGAMGLLLSDLGVRLMIERAPEGLPRLREIQLGPEVIGFAIVLSLAVGIAVGLLPLIQLGGGRARGALRESGRGSTTGRERTRARSLLVVGQVAMALVLLAAAGLLLQSFQQLRSVQAGIDPQGVLTMEIAVPGSRHPGWGGTAEFHQRLQERLETVPGVARASVTTSLPLRGSLGCAAVFVEDHGVRSAAMAPCVGAVLASPGYFETLRIPVRGEVPGWRDVQARSGGVVVSRALADRLWPGEDPVGKGVRPNGWGEPFYRVVGVTEDVRYGGLDQPPSEVVYYPLLPLEGAPLWSPPRSVVVAVRTETDRPEALTAAVRSAMAELDPLVPVANVQSMERVMARSLARTSFAMILLAISAGVALLLGAVGLYGVLSYLVGQRRREIGIRMALGARVEQVTGLILRHALVLAAVGTAVGLAASVALTRVLRSLLFEVSPTEPLVLGAVSLLLITVALVAGYLPARRAARTDPMIALRSD